MDEMKNIKAITEDHTHEWVVFSTALAEGWLMLQCVECGRHGTVENPSREEWSEAFHAPSRPYRWRDEARVVLKGRGSLYMMRTAAGGCECYTRRGVPEPGEYERVPAEITRPSAPLTAEQRQELEHLAELAGESGLCSLLFPLFIRSYQEHTGRRCASSVVEVARRIEAINGKGLHCSPSVVARVLRECAGLGPSR